MPTTITTAAAKTWEQSLALAVFTRRLSLMLDAGVSLQRALQILQEMPPPYGDAARDFQGRVEHGEHLSQAMADRPGLFPPVYTGMIRAGEVGGVPEETVQRLKKVLEREWKLANRHPSQEMPLFLLLSAGQSLPVTWEEMSSYHRTVTLSLFFEAFGMMLQSGVPILQAMRTVADLLPKGSHAGWAKATRNVVKGLLFTPEMERMGIFPPFALEMIQIGEESGSLDIMMHRLSESFEDDLEYRSVS